LFQLISKGFRKSAGQGEWPVWSRVGMYLQEKNHSHLCTRQLCKLWVSASNFWLELCDRSTISGKGMWKECHFLKIGVWKGPVFPKYSNWKGPVFPKYSNWKCPVFPKYSNWKGPVFPKYSNWKGPVFPKYSNWKCPAGFSHI